MRLKTVLRVSRDERENITNWMCGMCTARALFSRQIVNATQSLFFFLAFVVFDNVCLCPVCSTADVFLFFFARLCRLSYMHMLHTPLSRTESPVVVRVCAPCVCASVCRRCRVARITPLNHRAQAHWYHFTFYTKYNMEITHNLAPIFVCVCARHTVNEPIYLPATLARVNCIHILYAHCIQRTTPMHIRSIVCRPMKDH